MKIIADKTKLINPETGEVVEVIGIIPEEKDSDFVKVYKLFTRKVVEDLKAGIDGAIYTLMWFIDRVQKLPPQSDPVIVATPEEIANDLGLYKRTVERHIRILKERGYIEQLRKRHHVYRVNPRMIFKGVLTRYFRGRA